MKEKRQMLSPEKSFEWSQKAHAFLLQALMENHSWTSQSLVLHGGTSLHLSWNSPRFSEDLDFLLSKEVKNIHEIMKKVQEDVQEMFIKEDAFFSVNIVDKTKDQERMPIFNIKVSNEKYLGRATVKLEFWKVDEAYLKEYPSQLRTPKVGDLVADAQSVFVADLETAFCDKLAAFANRPHLKWRDIYDLWWIGTQTDSELNISKIVHQFKHNISAYSAPPDKSLSDLLKRFLETDTKEIVALADPDLKKWLPEKLWERLKGAGVEEMVLYTKEILLKVSLAMEQPNSSDNSLSLPKRFKK